MTPLPFHFMSLHHLTVHHHRKWCSMLYLWPFPLVSIPVSIKAGHSEPSCSTPAYQKVFRPVTRSMTRIPPVNAATPDAKERVDSRGSHRSTPDACFSIQLDASRPTITRARTPHEVTKSAWKPLTQPDVPSEELKRASTPATNPTAKRCRVTSSQAAKDSASKANRNVRSGMY